jgi:hypothetical protein
MQHPWYISAKENVIHITILPNNYQISISLRTLEETSEYSHIAPYLS